MDGKGLHCVKIDKTQVEGGEGDDKKTSVGISANDGFIAVLTGSYV